MVDLSSARQQQIVTATALLRQLPPASRLLVRGAAQALAAVFDALGLPYGESPCRAVRNGARAALWLGPDERLLLGPAEEAAGIEALAQRALAGSAHSLVDVSHAQVAFEVSGAHAASALNTGCPLDFDTACFPVDMCTRTVFAKAQIVLWRTGADSFRLETARSFAPYVSGILALAAREF
jgi:sarcosine oxidase, subunit gamma